MFRGTETLLFDRDADPLLCGQDDAGGAHCAVWFLLMRSGGGACHVGGLGAITLDCKTHFAAAPQTKQLDARRGHGRPHTVENNND